MKKKFFIPLFFLVIIEYCLCFFYFFNTYPLRFKDSILFYADSYNLKPELVAGVIWQESKFYSLAKSKKGAVGLMQVMPSTAKFVCEMLGEEYEYASLFMPEKNIKIGCKYLSYLQSKFNDERAVLCAYNAGETVTGRWLRLLGEGLNNIPYKQTKTYVEKIEKAEKYYVKRF